MGKRLVLIGGGHAHMMVLANLHKFIADGHEVTVIQPSAHHYYSGMGAGMLGGSYSADEIRFKTRQVVEQQGAIFIQDYATRIDADNREIILKGGQKVPYDVLSCNAGSQVPDQLQAQEDNTIIPVKPIEGLEKARAAILDTLRRKSMTTAIVGGGPSAVEIAGNLRQLATSSGLHPLQIQLFAGSGVMSHLPQKIQNLARKMLASREVEVIEGSYVRKFGNGNITLDDSTSYSADLIFSALGVKPSTIFIASGLTTGPDGGLLVNKYLQAADHDNIFGGGDCIHFSPQPLDKVGVYAVRQNPVLLHNLSASLQGGTLQQFTPGGKYLLIYNLGASEGILAKWSFVFAGRLAFRIKDYIDRKFMQTYQTLEK